MNTNGTKRWFGRGGLLAVSAVVAVACTVVSSASAHSVKPSTASTSEKQLQANLAAHVSGSVFAKIPPGLAVAHAGRGAREVALTFDDGPSTLHAPGARRPREGRAARDVLRHRSGRERVPRHAAAHRRRAATPSAITPSPTHSSSARTPPGARGSSPPPRSGCTRRPVVHVKLFRPPYGQSSTDINTLSRQLGLLPVTWSVDTRDWSRPGVSAIVATALRGVGPGDIILMHDGGGDRSETVAALPIILRALAKLHLTSVTLPELLNAQAPTHGDLEVCAC